jgi:hypothetical protein
MGSVSTFLFFYGVFVRFSTRGVQKHHKNFLWKVHEKVEGKNTSFLSSFPIDFFLNRVFGLSQHEEPKISQYFSEKISKNLPKKGR